MAKRQRTEDELRADVTGVSPLHEASRAEPSREHDEHRGLAGRILDLRNLVESERLTRIKDQGELKQRMALLDQQLTALEKRVDRLEAGELATIIARQRQQGMKQLDESQVPIDTTTVTHFADMAYQGQIHSIRVPIAGDWEAERLTTDLGFALFYFLMILPTRRRDLRQLSGLCNSRGEPLVLCRVLHRQRRAHGDAVDRRSGSCGRRER